MNFDFILNPIALRRDLHKLFEKAFDKHMPEDAVVYDIGCGQKPFATYLSSRVRQHIGVDLANGFYEINHVDLIGTAYAVPAEDSVADAAILSQVIEHLESPLLAMKELHRLLKPGGIIFLSFPFLYPQHAPPHDYLRYTEFYLTNQIADKNFEVLEQYRIGGYWYLSGMCLNMYLNSLNRGLLKNLYLIKLVLVVLGWLFLALHHFEGLVLRLAKKDPSRIRQAWTVNYLVILRKTFTVSNEGSWIEQNDITKTPQGKL
jgi:SAM-dependent methyltransferase